MYICTILINIPFYCSMFPSREGEEWFHNRRLLSRILLSGNLHWMDWHVRQCTNKLIAKWRDDLVQVKESSGYECMVIDDLEQQLYRWSIDGEYYSNGS